MNKDKHTSLVRWFADLGNEDVSSVGGKNASLGGMIGSLELKNGKEVTISCAEGDEGHVYDGMLEYDETEVNLEDLPEAGIVSFSLNPESVIGVIQHLAKADGGSVK